MSRRENREKAQDFIENLSSQPFPNSEKIYLTGSQDDILVAMRQINLTDTLVGGTKSNPEFESNEPVPVYDTSGPYTDPAVTIDVRQGLPTLRKQWIAERNDTDELDSVTSRYAQQRLADDGLDHLRFEHLPNPLRAKPGANVTQMHYARQGGCYPRDGVYCYS